MNYVRSKLTGIRTQRWNYPEHVSPECFDRSPDPDSPGFPLKRAGMTDSKRSRNNFLRIKVRSIRRMR